MKAKISNILTGMGIFFFTLFLILGCSINKTHKPPVPLSITMHKHIEIAVTPKPVIKYTKKDLECLTKNVHFEARGEGEKGMELVGHTTINRVLSKRFPNTVCDVVYQRKQFSWTHDSNPDIIYTEAEKHRAEQIAKEVLHRRTDNSKKSLYFYAHNKVRPSWRFHKTKTLRYKNHTFLK